MLKLGNQRVVGLVVADPEPQIGIGPLDRQGKKIETYTGRPDLLSVTFSHLLKLHRGMIRIGSQERELLVGTAANILRKPS